jgi:hypothetical protein
MAESLNVDALIEEAQRKTGLQRFDSESFREGLGILTADLNRQNVAEPFVQRNRNDIVKDLVTRLKTTAYLEARPELLQRPIVRPVFVFGVPRTGTTLLSNLLAADPARRSPLTWEMDDPIPPPTRATLYNDPRALARLDQERQMLAANPGMGKYYRSSAIYPNECIYITRQDFKALLWEGRGPLPNYREWLFSTDMTSAYEYHRRFLQLLQADAPGVWNLKMPSHALSIATLLKIYPDARLIWTHRDPLAAVGSFCSVMSLSHRGSIGSVDVPWLAKNYPWQAVEHAARIMDWRDRNGEERVIDVHYADLMREPISTMRQLYRALGDDFTPEIEASMQKWLDDNPQGKFGRHEHKLGEYGLTGDQVTKMFERYLSRYQVEPES